MEAPSFMFGVHFYQLGILLRDICYKNKDHFFKGFLDSILILHQI
jgi:hypothetical protein